MWRMLWKDPQSANSVEVDFGCVISLEACFVVINYTDGRTCLAGADP